jgi:uncharacterized glyoxalase superfamily protein PhnB
VIIPATRYRDCEAALAFLTGALGFEEHAVHRDGSGAIHHVELAQAGGLVMFGPWVDNAFAEMMVAPDTVGRRETTTVYVIVPDIETHHARASAAGAEIVQPLVEEPYGGRSYTVRDPEGHVWSFGEYDPRLSLVT